MTLVKQLLARVQDVKCFFARVRSTPQASTFTGLATTLEYEDEYAAEIPLLKLFSVSPDALDGTNSNVENALKKLVRVLSLSCQDELARFLEGASEKKQMVAIVRLLLQRLCRNIVLNKREYSAQFLSDERAALSRGWSGMGTRRTWRGAPDCRCTVDIVSTDKARDDDDESSDGGTDTLCSSAGTHVTVEGKKAHLGLYEMNQVVGHAVTYAFIHANRQSLYSSHWNIGLKMHPNGSLLLPRYRCVDTSLAGRGAMVRPEESLLRTGGGFGAVAPHTPFTLFE